MSCKFNVLSAYSPAWYVVLKPKSEEPLPLASSRYSARYLGHSYAELMETEAMRQDGALEDWGYDEESIVSSLKRIILKSNCQLM